MSKSSFSPRRQRALARAHRHARRHDLSRSVLYRLVRTLIVVPFMTVVFRPKVEGREHLKTDGAAILVANHRDVTDFFFQAYTVRRGVRWMAAAELFRWLPFRWLLVMLGAFPVQRGGSDTDAILTAKKLLGDGALVAVFPEGKIARGEGAEPKRGASRLATECQVPVIPMSIVGSDELRVTSLLDRARIRIDAPIPPPAPVALEQPEVVDAEAESAAHHAAQVARDYMTEQIWPKVRGGVEAIEHDRNKAIAAGLGAAALGVGAALLRAKTRRK